MTKYLAALAALFLFGCAAPAGVYETGRSDWDRDERPILNTACPKSGKLCRERAVAACPRGYDTIRDGPNDPFAGVGSTFNPIVEGVGIIFAIGMAANQAQADAAGENTHHLSFRCRQ